MALEMINENDRILESTHSMGNCKLLWTVKEHNVEEKEDFGQTEGRNHERTESWNHGQTGGQTDVQFHLDKVIH